MARRQIDVLVELQELDQKRSRNAQSQQELRQKLADIRLELEDAEKKVAARRQEVKELEDKYGGLEGQLKAVEGEIKEKRVHQARTNNKRKISDTQREIDSVQKKKGELEENALQVFEQLEDKKKDLAQSQDCLAKVKVRCQQEEERTKSEIADLEREERQLREERGGLVRCLDPTLLSRYERIFAKCGGLAVVQIQQRTCKGCHMRLPPQLCNQIQSGELQRSETIYYCPHCTRIIYWPKSAEEEPTA